MKIEVVVLKVTNKIAKTGKDIKSLFAEWDKDGNEERKFLSYNFFSRSRGADGWHKKPA